MYSIMIYGCGVGVVRAQPYILASLSTSVRSNYSGGIVLILPLGDSEVVRQQHHRYAYT